MSCMLSKFAVYTSVLFFMLLLALKLDGLITLTFWSVFSPLFIWKVLVLFGAVVGTVVWCMSPQLRGGDSRLEFQSMWLSLVLCLQLTLFEILCCVKLDTIDSHSEDSFHLSWFTVFAPLIFSTPYSCFYFWWLYKRDRSFILELLHASNLLFFLFVTIKLDGMVNWSWALVFVPVWLLACVFCFVVIYCTFWSILMLRQMSNNRHVMSSVQRSYYIRIITTGLVLLCPLITFLVLLVHKLESVWNLMEYQERQVIIDSQLTPDSEMGSQFEQSMGPLNPDKPVVPVIWTREVGDMDSLPWVVTMSPLYITLLGLIASTIGTKGGNRWFFGLHTDFFSLLVNLCPCLKEYANISFKQTNEQPDNDSRGPISDDNQNATAGRQAESSSRSTSSRSHVQLGGLPLRTDTPLAVASTSSRGSPMINDGQLVRHISASSVRSNLLYGSQSRDLESNEEYVERCETNQIPMQDKREMTGHALYCTLAVSGCSEVNEQYSPTTPSSSSSTNGALNPLYHPGIEDHSNPGVNPNAVSSHPDQTQPNLSLHLKILALPGHLSKISRAPFRKVNRNAFTQSACKDEQNSLHLNIQTTELSWKGRGKQVLIAVPD